nr:immunoglobulin heavy chain junction region [Mus musculus]MBK4197250.1 immunoglobulin heavy chain junction region [Mus musculus]
CARWGLRVYFDYW